MDKAGDNTEEEAETGGGGSEERIMLSSLSSCSLGFVVRTVVVRSLCTKAGECGTTKPWQTLDAEAMIVNNNAAFILMNYAIKGEQKEPINESIHPSTPSELGSSFSVLAFGIQ